ncbi:MAG TPA: biotin--[acetyl-CoA-carboxylase] ligase, partial [Leeuwenhoekiella sp.]|nr:biotin--[acetyl-CoA-carboxylase] ligase [Leeuwenhoekiella sp.]
IIKQVSETGKLILQLEDELYKEFDLKELKLLY